MYNPHQIFMTHYLGAKGHVHDFDLDLDLDNDLHHDQDLDLDLWKNNLFWRPCMSDLHQIFMKLFLSAKDHAHDNDPDLDHDLHLDHDLDLHLHLQKIYLL